MLYLWPRYVEATLGLHASDVAHFQLASCELLPGPHGYNFLKLIVQDMHPASSSSICQQCKARVV